MSLNSFKPSLKISAIVFWVIAGFLAAQIIVVDVLRLVVHSDIVTLSATQTPLAKLLLLVLGYCLAFVIVLFPYYLFPGLLFPELSPKNKHYLAKCKELLGIHKKPDFKNIGWVLLGYVAYVALSTIFSIVVSSLWPGFNPGQLQLTGFENIAGRWEVAITMIALVLVPPFIEELLFRGFLFGKLRQHAPFWVSTLITSVVFGLVHLQWNVGLDVFALSLVLCYLRHRTGTIWASIGLHLLKNGIAFTLLFIYPNFLKSLL